MEGTNPKAQHMAIPVRASPRLTAATAKAFFFSCPPLCFQLDTCHQISESGTTPKNLEFYVSWETKSQGGCGGTHLLSWLLVD